MACTKSKYNVITNQIKFLKKATFNKNTTLQNLISQVGSTSTWLLAIPKQNKLSTLETMNRPQNFSISIPRNTYIYVKPIKNGSALFISGARGLIYICIPDKKFVLEKTATVLNIKYFNNLEYSDISWIKNLYRIFVGVNRGYKKHINIIGVGYKSYIQDTNIFKLVLGYSHDVYYKLNNKLNILLGRKNNKFIIRGTSLPLISNVTASVHHFKKPDIYRGKGLRYRGVALPFKEGKKKK